MKHYPPVRSSVRACARLMPAVGTAVILAACTSTPPPPPPAAPQVYVRPEPAPDVQPPADSVTTAPPMGAMRASAASNPRAYRKDAASHIYEQNATRIFKGRMPPLLYAIGVLNVEVDRNGQVQKLDWMRKPNHAPEVVKEIERTVRAAEPFPVPARMGKVVYTDTWLWHKSGRFQLDTLTEGQD